MKYKILTSVALAVLFMGAACSQSAPTVSASADGYNAELAERLGADEYGMRSYVMVVLHTGPEDAKITDADQRKQIFAGHFANMKTLAEDQKLVLSGPFIEGGTKRGMYIFNVGSIEEAQGIVQTDPAVAAGIFTPEFIKYYGSAALMDIQNIHKTIQKTKI